HPPDIRDQLVAAVAYDKMLAIYTNIGGQVCDEGVCVGIRIEVVVLKATQRRCHPRRWRGGALIAFDLDQSLDRHASGPREGIEGFAGDVCLHTGNLGTDLHPCVHALHGSSSHVTSLCHTTHYHSTGLCRSIAPCIACT